MERGEKTIAYNPVRDVFLFKAASTDRSTKKQKKDCMISTKSGLSCLVAFQLGVFWQLK